MPSLQAIADALGVPCPSHGDREIRSANGLKDAGPNELSVLSADRYVREYGSTRAGAVIAGRKIRFSIRPDVPTLIVDEPELAMVTALEMLSPPVPQPAVGIHPTAVVSPEAVIETDVAIGPNVTIGAGTRIGSGTRIHAGVVIGEQVSIGNDCVFFPNTVIRERVTIGNRVILHACVIIGTDGFGYKWDGRQHRKVPQIGTVVIEDDVEIGSCTCVDRAKFFETRIGRGTKIDNQVQVAHNVVIGQHSILCGQVGIAGSAKIGHGVVLGGATVVRDHITIGDRAVAAGHSAIFESVPSQTTVSGVPAMAHRQTLREQGAIRRLPEVLVELRRLQMEIETLKEQLAQQKTD